MRTTTAVSVGTFNDRGCDREVRDVEALMQPRADVPDADDLLGVLFHWPELQHDAACRGRGPVTQAAAVTCAPSGSGDGPVVFGVVVFGVFVVTVVVGDDDDGGAGYSAASALGGGAGAGGAGAGGAGSFSTAGLLGAGAGGVVTAGAAAGCGATGAAVVGTGLVSDCAGLSVSFITAVTDPKPMSSAATHASGSKTARPPNLANKERPSSSAAGRADSAAMSSCRCGAPPASGGPMGSVGSFTSGTRGR